jgi:dihydroorotase
MNVHIKGGTLVDPAAGSENRADLFVADEEMNVLLTVLDGEIVYRGDAPC